MAAPNMCSNFGSKWSRPPLKVVIVAHFVAENYSFEGGKVIFGQF